jgi:NADP-dependent 3-hydroxy acid dehydrogenase YdfG
VPELQALVTGSQGIGLATAALLADTGHRVILVGRDQQAAQATVDALTTRHRDRITCRQASVADEAGISAVIADLRRLDVLVNNAGVSLTGPSPVADTPTETWREIIDTNLTGAFYTTRAALPLLRQAPAGHIVNVLSLAAYRSKPGTAAYSASKHGLRALTEALTEELRGTSVKVSAVAPGRTNTTVWDKQTCPPDDTERDRMVRPEDIAEAILWIISRPARVHIPAITVEPWIQGW